MNVSRSLHRTKLIDSLARALRGEPCDTVVPGVLDLSGTSGQVVLRYNMHARLEIPEEGILPDSIRKFSCKELRELAGTVCADLASREWVYVTIRNGTKCVLHYKTVSVELELSKSQWPFHIDTESLEIKYLDPVTRSSGALTEISCSDQSPDRLNMELLAVWTNRACCCSNNAVELYGTHISCDDRMQNAKCK